LDEKAALTEQLQAAVEMSNEAEEVTVPLLAALLCPLYAWCNTSL